MTIQTAKTHVKKAMRNREFAERTGLPITSNYELIAFNNAYYKLSPQDAETFGYWYDNLKPKKVAIKQRLEELRKELRAERISTGELLELQSLIPYIDKGDVELLEAAGVPEFEEELPSEDTYYIEYLNAAKRHARDRAEFANYNEAVIWGKANLENFNSDMIRIKH